MGDPNHNEQRLVFITGPFRAPNSWEIEQNVRRAEELALAAWRAGFAVICPHTNTRCYQGAAPDEVWLSGDLTILRRCDALLLVPGWERSEGSKQEVKEAGLRGIPTFSTLQDLLLWDHAKYPRAPEPERHAPGDRRREDRRRTLLKMEPGKDRRRGERRGVE